MTPWRMFLRLRLVRHAAKLMLGSAASQIVMLLAIPLLTRLYLPAEFALVALFAAVTALLATLSTGHYELAIVLAESDEEAVALGWLGFLLCGSCAALIAFLLTFLVPRGTYLFGILPFAEWRLLLPVAVVAAGGVAILTRLAARRECFGQQSLAELMGTVVNVVVAIGLYCFRYPSDQAMTISFVLGRVAAALVLSTNGFAMVSHNRSSIAINSIRLASRKHWRFPAFAMPAEFVAILNLELPRILLGCFFPIPVVGLYAVCSRVLERPVLFVNSSICPPFYRLAVELIDRPAELRRLIVKTSLLLAAAAVVPTLVIMVEAPSLFALAFGEPWREAGRFARILAPMLAVRFATVPTWTALLVAKRQHLVLVWNLLFLAATSLGLCLGGMIQNITLSLVAYAATASIMFYGLLATNLRSLTATQSLPTYHDISTPTRRVA